jgi:hypothetical protein
MYVFSAFDVGIFDGYTRGHTKASAGAGLAGLLLKTQNVTQVVNFGSTVIYHGRNASRPPKWTYAMLML